MELNVIYEDNHLLVLNKPAGMLVHGDKTGDISYLSIAKDYIKKRYKKPGDVFMGTVHRLDRPVSGCLILARTSKALSRLNRMMQSREIDKTYLAIISAPPQEMSGKVEHFLIKDHKTNKVKVVKGHNKKGKKAMLSYQVIANADEYFLVEVKPATGRPHQIRVQLNALGIPIVGDGKYGSPLALSDRSIGLHCYKMSFIHPVKKEKMNFIAGIPQNALWDRFKSLLPDI
jgi:23S rRNA pseudouridine1911/1915/1917 synthase